MTNTENTQTALRLFADLLEKGEGQIALQFNPEFFRNVANELDKHEARNHLMYNLLTQMRRASGLPQELIETFFDVTEEYEQRQKESQ
jgi:hypothetical protein